MAWIWVSLPGYISETQRAQAVGVQGFVDFKEVPVPVDDVILDNHVGSIGMGEGKPAGTQEIFCLGKVELQSNGKCEHSFLCGSILPVAADLGEVLGGDSGGLVAFDLGHSAFFDESQENVGEAFVLLDVQKLLEAMAFCAVMQRMGLVFLYECFDFLFGHHNLQGGL